MSSELEQIFIDLMTLTDPPMNEKLQFVIEDVAALLSEGKLSLLFCKGSCYMMSNEKAESILHPSQRNQPTNFIS